jgi:hypothetical protein
MAVLLVLPWYAVADDCKADADHPVRVCFTDVQFLRCVRQIRPVFYIDLYYSDHRYLYTVNIYKGEPKRANLKNSFFSSVPQEVLGHRPPKGPHDFSIANPGETDIDGEYTVEVVAQYADDDSVKGTASITKSIEYKRHVRAVIVGVSKYKKGKDDDDKDKSTLEFPIANLNFAASDATAFRDFLAEFFPENSHDQFSSTLLQDAEATKQRLQHELEVVRQEDAACEGDLFIFYFSGHTFASSVSATRWLGTWDVDPNPATLVEDGFSYDELFNSYLSNKVIKADKILLFDSCFSGFTRSQDDDGSLGTTSGGITEADQGKLEVVDVNGQLRRDILPQQPDDREQNDIMDEWQRLGPSVAVLAATNIDRQAQEGMVATQPPSGRSYPFIFSDEQRITGKGHGLFTYALFVGLEKQMAAAHQHSDFAGDGQADHYWIPGECQLNLKQAMEAAQSVVEDIQKSRNKPLQELFYWRKQDPKTIHCPKDVHK